MVRGGRGYTSGPFGRPRILFSLAEALTFPVVQGPFDFSPVWEFGLPGPWNLPSLQMESARIQLLPSIPCLTFKSPWRAGSCAPASRLQFCWNTRKQNPKQLVLWVWGNVNRKHVALPSSAVPSSPMNSLSKAKGRKPSGVCEEVASLPLPLHCPFK